MNTLTYMEKIVRMIEKECKCHDYKCKNGAHACILYLNNINFDSGNCGAVSIGANIEMNI